MSRTTLADNEREMEEFHLSGADLAPRVVVTASLPADQWQAICEDVREWRVLRERERVTKRATHRLCELEDELGYWRDVWDAMVPVEP